MSVYMMQVSYIPEHFAALAKEPRDRSKDVAALMEKLGGRLIGFWYSFGDQDAVLIFEAPNEKAAAAGILTGIGAGHIRSSRTTQLLSVADALEALRLAGGLSIQAPGGRK